MTRRPNLRSHTFWTLFFSYFLLCMVALISSLTITWRRDVEESARQLARENERTAVSFSAIVEDTLSDVLVLSGRLSSAVWVNKMLMDVPSINAEFTASRRTEIMQDFLFSVSDSSLIRFIFVVFPDRDVCVGLNTWCTINQYLLRFYKDASEGASLLKNIRAARGLCALDVGEAIQDCVLLCAPADVAVRPRAYLCVALDWRRVRDAAERAAPAELTGLRIEDLETGATIFSLQRGTEETNQVVERTSLMANWQYVFDFSADGRIVADASRELTKRSGWLLLAVLPASLLLALFTYRPLGALLRRMGKRSTPGKSDYEIIGESFVKMESDYNAFMRAACMRRLLDGDATESELGGYGIPFTEDKCYQTYLLPVQDRSEDESRMFEQLMRQLTHVEGAHFELVDRESAGLVVIAAFEDEAAAREKHPTILQAMDESWKITFSGDIRPGLGGVRASFRYAAEKYEHMYQNAYIRYAFPAETAAKLFRAIRAGEMQTALAVVRGLRADNDRLLAAETIDDADYQKLLCAIVDIFRREDCDGSLVSALARCSTQEIWPAFEEACQRLCGQVESRDERSELFRDMLAFVEASYADAALSLTMLETRFGVSASTINRLFKSQGGDTFYAWLTRLRLDKARLLLVEGCSVAETSRRAGYENESSFRRAFLHHTGIRPQDYAEHMKSSETTND